MTHTILLLNGPALNASGVPVQGVCNGNPLRLRPADSSCGRRKIDVRRRAA